MSRSPQTLRSMQPRERLIAGSFRPNGNSAVSSTYNTGSGWSVARTASGVFTLTLEENYSELVAAVSTVQLSTLADVAMQFGDADVEDGPTLILTAHTAGTGVDIDSDADNRIMFAIVVRKGN